MKYFALYRLLIIVAIDGVCLCVYIKYPALCAGMKSTLHAYRYGTTDFYLIKVEPFIL